MRCPALPSPEARPCSLCPALQLPEGPTVRWPLRRSSQQVGPRRLLPDVLCCCARVMQGTPNIVVSSWIPSESVRTILAFDISLKNGDSPSGSMKYTPALVSGLSHPVPAYDVARQGRTPGCGRSFEDGPETRGHPLSDGEQYVEDIPKDSWVVNVLGLCAGSRRHRAGSLDCPSGIPQDQPSGTGGFYCHGHNGAVTYPPSCSRPGGCG